MVTLLQAQRRSVLLKPSDLACLCRIPTINLTAGCAIGCIYCYAVGFSQNPGDGVVTIYSNTLEKLKDELARKHTKPPAVYFSPSSDIFQPLDEVLDLAHRVLQFLLSNGIGVAFVTKGLIPGATMRLLLDHAELVQSQIGIITLNEDMACVFEPHAASPAARLAQMGTLINGGVKTIARVAPVLPNVTDGHDALRNLFSALERVGVRRAAASALFLRSAITASLKRGIQDKRLLGALLSPYRGAGPLAVRTHGSSIIALPRATREDILNRVRTAAEASGVALSICACMNPDLASGTCGVSGVWPARPQRALQRRLFSLEV